MFRYFSGCAQPSQKKSRQIITLLITHQNHEWNALDVSRLQKTRITEITGVEALGAVAGAEYFRADAPAGQGST